MNWLRRLIPSIGTFKSKSKVPDGLWSSCKKCESVLYAPELEKSLFVCPKCDYHLRIGARQRLDMFLDNSNYSEIAPDLTTKDPLKFKDSKHYTSRIKEAVASTGEKEALLVVSGELDQLKVIVAAFEFRFMGGSMGSVVGEKIARAIDFSINKKIPLLIISKSGGARMMEAAISLMQLAKTSAKLAQLAEAKIPYISLCTDPTTGGTTASFAMLGDVNISEPGALIGFAGPRVVKDTTGKDLPEGFQTAEFVLDHGFLDFISHRKDLKKKINLFIDLISNKPVRE